jgi:hypothetical protein
VPADYTPLGIIFEDQIAVLGYRLESSNVEVGEEIVVDLAWRPISEIGAGNTLFAHLVGEDAQIYAQQDQLAPSKSEGITLTQLRLTSQLNSKSGQYTLMIGARDADLLTDSEGRTRVPITSLTISAASSRPYTQNPTNRELTESESGKRLIGYDWDHTLETNQRLYLHWQTEYGVETETHDFEDGIFEMPDWYGPWGIEMKGTRLISDGSSFYVPFSQGITWIGNPISPNEPLQKNQILSLSQHFVSSRPVTRDLIVSERLVGYEEDGLSWAWWDLDDSVPAMGAIPTLKWIAGSYVRAPHWLKVSEKARPGQKTGPILRLYDAFSSRQLPILDERINQVFPWVPQGITTIENKP